MGKSINWGTPKPSQIRTCSHWFLRFLWHHPRHPPHLPRCWTTFTSSASSRWAFRNWDERPSHTERCGKNNSLLSMCRSFSQQETMFCCWEVGLLWVCGSWVNILHHSTLLAKKWEDLQETLFFYANLGVSGGDIETMRENSKNIRRVLPSKRVLVQA